MKKCLMGMFLAICMIGMVGCSTKKNTTDTTPATTATEAVTTAMTETKMTETGLGETGPSSTENLNDATKGTDNTEGVVDKLGDDIESNMSETTVTP